MNGFRRINWIFLLFFLFTCKSGYGQTNPIDSLLLLLRIDKEDTNKIKHLCVLCSEYRKISEYEKGLSYGKEAVLLAVKLVPKTINVKRYSATAHNNLGNIYIELGNYSEALTHHLAALNLRKEIRDISGLSNSFNNLGLISYFLGNYPDALNYYFKSLKISEDGKNAKGIIRAYTNISNVYEIQGDYGNALKNSLAALKFGQETKNEHDIAIASVAIGTIYWHQNNFKKALLSYFSTLKLLKPTEKKELANLFGNIGAVYVAEAEYLLKEKNNKDSINFKLELGLKYSSIALKTREEIGDKEGLASSYINIGAVQTRLKKYDQAKSNLNKAVIIGKELNSKEILKTVYAGFSTLFENIGDFKSGMAYHKLFDQYKDSLDNEQSRKKTVELRITNEFEKKEAVSRAEHKKELESQKIIAEEKSKKQKMVLFFVVSGLMVSVLFAVFILRALFNAKKQKKLIEFQKNEVEKQKRIVDEHQKEILDSIFYAQRIQKSLLPTEKYIDRILAQYESSNSNPSEK